MMKILKAAICMAALGFTMGAHGQNYPTKPVRLINPWTPAGPA
jgi:tripartite-type tricarboxylate transporter receptor subunit TctC